MAKVSSELAGKSSDANPNGERWAQVIEFPGGDQDYTPRRAAEGEATESGGGSRYSREAKREIRVERGREIAGNLRDMFKGALGRAKKGIAEFGYQTLAVGEQAGKAAGEKLGAFGNIAINKAAELFNGGRDFMINAKTEALARKDAREKLLEVRQAQRNDNASNNASKRREAENLFREQAEARGSISENRRELSENRLEIRAKNREIEELKAEQAKIEAEIQEQKIFIQDKKARLDTLNSAGDNSRSTERGKIRLELDIEEATEKIGNLNGKRADIASRLDSAVEDMETLEAKRSDVKERSSLIGRAKEALERWGIRREMKQQARIDRWGQRIDNSYAANYVRKHPYVVQAAVMLRRGLARARKKFASAERPSVEFDDTPVTEQPNTPSSLGDNEQKIAA